MQDSHNPGDDISAKVELLKQKFSNDDQSINTHLDGLYHSKYINYWEYIHLDTLLTLQTPRTDFPDELIFITYHQITELYFKLILHEMMQLREKADIDGDYF
ncbi:MAG TPA: tryptophan 2,3-dioxygenase family protein, partial [Cytophagaceae bacterium]|nr:tryptophan 2,3-dioxygenase family protein [Cytophagaceae bacterium]